ADRTVDDHMRRLDLAQDPGFFADDEDAVALADGDHVTLHLAIDAQTLGEAQFTHDDGALADQRADRRLLFLAEHLVLTPTGAERCGRQTLATWVARTPPPASITLIWTVFTMACGG